MHTHPVNVNPMLRLVQPPHVASRPARSTAATAAPRPGELPRSADGDSFSFSAIHESQIPRIERTEAHRRLDRIRSLVAAKTHVPIHFDGQPVAARPANPYANAYTPMRLPADPADFNAAVTDRQAGKSNSTERVG